MRCLIAAGVVLSLSMFACAEDATTPIGGAEPAPASASQEVAAAGRVGSHSHIIVGTPSDAIISHIPIFGGSMHNVQSIVAGAMVATDGTTLPSSFGDQEFSFGPDTMSLDALRTGSLASIGGTLYLGNFDSAGGRPVAQVKFTFARVVHTHVLEQGAARGDLSYFLTNAGGATYAFHEITTAPGFDDILKVNVSGGPSAGELSSVVKATFVGTGDDAGARLSVSGGGTATANGRTFSLTRSTVLSCLAGPGYDRPCN